MSGPITVPSDTSDGVTWSQDLTHGDSATNVLAMLATTGERLSKLAGRLPPIHIVHEEVVTPWEQKGTVSSMV